MDAIEQSPASNALAHLTRVPIAQLSPDLDNSAEKSFLANVALVWPYSSSAKSFSLLLVEPDVLLRRSQGQIKVTFHGRVAEKVAESHVGIGETICLALKDCKFVNNADPQQSPGGCLAWEAHFENSVSLVIHRPSESLFTVSVEPPAPAPAPQGAELVSPPTPSGKSINPDLDLASSTGSWGSPVFIKPNQSSLGATIRSAFDPFAEEDGSVPGKGRKRPRYSLQREDWRVLTEPETPQEQESPVDWQQALDQAIDQELAEAEAASEPSDDLMTDPDEITAHTEGAPQEPLPVFVKPSLELTGSILERRAGESQIIPSHEQIDSHGKSFQIPTDTPQIRPIPSPGLPIPSPIVSSNASSASYFPLWNASTQAQASTGMDTVATLQDRCIGPHDIEAIHTTEAAIPKPVEPDIERQDGHILDPDLLLRSDTQLSSGPANALLDRDIDLVDTVKPVNESYGNQDELGSNIPGDGAQCLIETQQDDGLRARPLSRDHSESSSESGDELEESSKIMGKSAAAQAGIGTVSPDNGPRISNDTKPRCIVDGELSPGKSSVPSSHSNDKSVQPSEVVDAVELAQANIDVQVAGENVRPPQHPSVFCDDKQLVLDDQSVEYTDPTAVFDQDAIDALEMMRATKEEEFAYNRYVGDDVLIEDDIDYSSNRNDSEREDETKIQDDVDHSSPAKQTLDCPSIEVDDDEEDDISQDQGVNYEESPHSYNSQYDYEEENEEEGDIHYPRSETGSNQSSFGIDESSDEEFEHEQNFASRGGEPEVIVLDTDSDDDDEFASKNPTAPAAEFSSDEDGSDHSERQTVPSALVDVEMSERETPESRYGDSEASYHRAVEEEDDIDRSEKSEESDYSHGEEPHLENVTKDDQTHEDDIGNESAQDLHESVLPSETTPLNPEQEDENKDMENTALIEVTEKSEGYSAITLGSTLEVAADQDSDERRSVNIDPSLFDAVGSQHLEASEATGYYSQRETLSGSEHVNAYIYGDRQSDYPFPVSATHDTADLSSKDEPMDEPAVEGPEPLGGLVLPSTMPLIERHLLTPDPTQEATHTAQLDQDDEPDYSAVEENEDDRGLGMMVQLDGSPDFDQDANAGADPTENNQGHDHSQDDSTALSEVSRLAKLPSTPERSCSVEVLISTESPKPPPVLVTKPPAPDRNASGFRSKLSYFAPLASLFDHYNALVDTISVVHEVSAITRAKAGSKDWFVTIELSDPSMAGTTVRAQIFRRYKSSMPTLAEGAAILLRDFKVKSLDHTVMLVSVESSAWAVFDGSGPDAEMNGPPVEYDSQERAYASGLRRWYIEVGSGWIADRMLQASIECDSLERDLSPSSQAQSESSSPDSKRGSQRRRKGNGRVAIHELRDGTRYTDAGSPNSRNSSVHELRDGTLYATL